MIQRTNPTYSQSILYGGADNEKQLFNNDLFEFNFGISDFGGGFFIDPSIFTISATLHVHNDDGTISYYALDTEICSDDPKKYNYNAFCLSEKQSKIDHIYLKSVGTQYIQLDYRRCIPGYSLVPCASVADINTKLSQSLVNNYYSVWTIDPSNYDNPMKKSIKNVMVSIVKAYTKVMSLNFIPIIFTSDDGWLTSSERVLTAVNAEELLTDLNEDGPTIQFYTAVFQMGGNKMVYKRKYDKIQDVLARVSGTIGGIMIILGIFTIPYARKKMFEPLVNGIFDVKVKDHINMMPKTPEVPLEASLTFRQIQNPVLDDQRMSLQNFQNFKNGYNGIPLKNQMADEEIIFLDKPSSQFRSRRISQAPYRNTTNTASNISTPTIEPISLEPKQILMKNRNEEEANELSRNKRVSISYNTVVSRKASIQKSPLLDVFKANPRLQNLRETFSNRATDDFKPNISFDDVDNSWIHNKNGDEVNSSQIAFHHPQSELLSESPLDIHKNISSPGQREDTTIAMVNPNGPRSRAPADTARISPDTHLNHDKKKSVSEAQLKAVSNGLKMSYFEWIKSFISPQVNDKLLDMGTIEITRSIDILTILKRFREIDNLKLCLLSERQRVLFDNIPKPQLVIDADLDLKDKGFIEFKGWRESYEGDKEKLAEASRGLRSCDNKSSVDKQILLLFEGKG